MSPDVVVRSLSKTYGKILALDRLSFTVEAGSIYGLIGPNGAGKTTSLAILAGLIRPSSGAAWILGQQVLPDNCRLMSRIGFASPQFPFFDYLTGMEIVLTCGLMHGLAATEAKRRTLDLLDLLDLETCSGQYLHQYSQGMRLKLGLACALIHAPAVLLLDEPFMGLDPISVYRLACSLRQMASKGRTILLSSHDMAQVERLCRRVAILHKGTLQREIEPASRCDRGPADSAVHSDCGLESALWEVVGRPEIKELGWI